MIEMPAPTPTTLIDAVNSRDEPVGTVPRGEVLQRGENFRTAHVFVSNHKGHLLLQRLAGGRERHPERWGSSVAAYLFAGETYQAGAARRLREELGLNVSLRPVGKLEMHDEHSLKFVALFMARSDFAEVRERGHIAQIEYRPIQAIERQLEEDPRNFTPTFKKLFEKFGERLD